MEQMKEATAVAYRTESTECYPDRDAGAVSVQVNILDELLESLMATVRRAERRVENVLNPGCSPVGIAKLSEAQETLSPLADRLRSANDHIRGLTAEIDAWSDRVEL